MRKTTISTAKPLTKRSIFDKLKARSKQNKADQISKNKTNKPKKESAMTKKATITTAPTQPKDWTRIRETAKTIAITILATAIVAFAAGVWYEKQNTQNVLSANTTSEAPQSKQ